MTEPFVRARAVTPIATDALFPRARFARLRAARHANWARTEAERCTSNCGENRRCMLREGHDGLHAWRSLGGLRTFEWS